jgi:hypothetical protein
VSGYASFGNSPIIFIDPNGDDWYKNNNYNPKQEGSKQYVWFKGSGNKEGYEHLGAYLVTADKEKNTLKFVYQNYEWTDKIDLNTDVGAKFRIVAGESNFIDHDGDGTADRSPLVDLFIISAMVDNRVASSAYPNTNKEVIEVGGGEQFNAAISPTYKNLIGQLGNWNKWYGEGQVMQYLGDVHFATAHSPSSSRGAVKMLTTKFQMVNADKLLAYNHNVSNYESFRSKTVFLTHPSGSWMKTINTSGWLYPDLLKTQEDAKKRQLNNRKNNYRHEIVVAEY